MAAPIKLSRDQVADLQKTQRELHDIVEEFSKAESCGIDCQLMRNVHADAMEQIEQLLKHYK